jgi:hypothetical protein
MIYARLVGGLGNQLFQYATARALSLRLGVGLGLDRRYLHRDPAHLGYALNHFAILADIDPVGLPPHKTQALAHGLWRIGLGRPRFLRERGLGINSAVMQARDGTYLHGYFQSEGYFADVIAQIRAELTIITPPSAENADWLARIAADGQAVSVHLRRGDYVTVAKGSATHGTCDADYYRGALAEIAQGTGLVPRAYVFSDDPGWARANLDLGVETVVLGHNGPMQHYEDLRLMAACRHHVAANSTFSWWGAWLDPAVDKIVVAPARWFATDDLVNPDILPAGWIRM